MTEVGTRTAESSGKAAELTTKAVTDAGLVMTQAAEQARKAITDADASTRKAFETTVTAAQTQLRTELQRLFGGETPELVERLQPILATFGSELDAKVAKQTTELLSTAARQFDPSDPTSPMAKHAAVVAQQQAVLTSTLAQNHGALTAKVEALTTAVTVASAAQQAASRTASVTTLKGVT